jgi:hypothetical protein
VSTDSVVTPLAVPVVSPIVEVRVSEVGDPEVNVSEPGDPVVTVSEVGDPVVSASVGALAVGVPVAGSVVASDSLAPPVSLPCGLKHDPHTTHTRATRR